jgi:hypothetical protein
MKAGRSAPKRESREEPSYWQTISLYHAVFGASMREGVFFV